MQKISTMLVVAAALVDDAGRILLQQRPDGKAMAGLWEFPGGKVEEGELPELALVRELAEELGLEIDAAALVPTCFASAQVDERHMILLLYLCRDWAGEPCPLQAAAMQWSRPGEMRALPMPPADEPLIDLIEAIL